MLSNIALVVGKYGTFHKLKMKQSIILIWNPNSKYASNLVGFGFVDLGHLVTTICWSIPIFISYFLYFSIILKSNTLKSNILRKWQIWPRDICFSINNILYMRVFFIVGVVCLILVLLRLFGGIVRFYGRRVHVLKLLSFC